ATPATDEHAGHDHATLPSVKVDTSLHVKASHLSKYLGMWSYAGVVGGEGAKEKFAGRWIQFKGDGTFESGIWEEKNNQGHWYADPDTKIIKIAYDKGEEIHGEWRVQGGGDTMIWLGNTPNNPKSTQIKMALITERPKKN
ncbi:MAG: hypothetical protein AB8G15_04065, partial [Saprospiraceae bacterium]